MPRLDERVIFDAAREIEEHEARRVYLKQACNDDHALLARVQALLRVHDEETTFLNLPALPPSALAAAVSEGPGTQIGAFKLVEQIGEGGFGMVFLAEQQQPVRRLVALKIVKPGMDTRQVIARFEAERQALAIMEHPNIARMLDGGATTSGRPYFVMELVKGVPITRYCDEHRLTPRDRLVLFSAVCQAVQHAHQKGVIHRDLKPTNVLVAAYDGMPVPKVIDFGVAKALGERLTERTLVTGFGNIIGTLEYMSPEQAEFNALDVDTRADIYSMGVLLYELLTGTTPLTHARLKQTAMTEALRLIREEEPPKPSTRLSESKDSLASISAQRKLEPAMLTQQVRGELDWIVMKALEKDRALRYETVNSLARDVERYLNDDPVEACPPSTVYKLRKFARKNRKLLLAVAAFALVLTAATTVSVALTLRATLAERATIRERDRAEAEAKRARRHVYVAHMNVAQSAWEGERLGRLAALLEEHRPQSGDEDLRGFEWYYWQRLTNTALLSLEGHRGPVINVRYSPNGKLLASASHDGSAKVWDATSGQELRTLKGHKALVIGVAFSPDGNRLATASADQSVQLWDVASGENLRTLKGHTRWVANVAFSPDGKWLASASHDGTVKLWDSSNGDEVRTIKAHQDLVIDVAFSPDGTRLASASKDQTVKLWDAVTGSELLTLKGHAGEVIRVAFSLDGKWLASASLDRTVKIWDADSGQIRSTLTGHSERVYGVAFSPDSRQLASSSFDQTIKLWDVASGREIETFKGHTGWVPSVVFSPDGRRMASASDDRTVKVWDVSGGQETMLEMREYGFVRPVTSIAFSRDGDLLASTSYDPKIKIWDTASGQKLRMLKGHKGIVMAAVFQPDGKCLASGSEDKTVKIWDTDTGREIRTLTGPELGVLSVAYSADGQWLAAGAADKTIRVWDAIDGTKKLTLRGHSDAVKSVAFSPNGKWLASGSVDQTIKVWDLHSGFAVLTLKGHSGGATGVACVAFSPDGSRLASAGADHTVRVWDAASGQELLNLKGHVNWVASVAFSPDGMRLVSGSADKTIQIWDLTTGQESLTLREDTERVTAVAFCLDGRRLATASFDGKVRLWDARPWTAQLRIEQQARSLFRSLYATVGLKSEIIRRLEREVLLTTEVRQAAFDMASRCEEDPDWLNQKGWSLVVDAHETPENYELGLRQAEAACRLKADGRAFLNTLGVALYRGGRFQESFDTLARAEQLNSATSESQHPCDVAFRAMAQFKLGQIDEAQAMLNKLRLLIEQPAWSGDAEAQSFAREATELMEGRP